MKLEILIIDTLKGFDCWVHLLSKLEENVPAESFAKLREFFDQSAIISCQNNKDANWNILRVPSERLDLLL